MPIYKIGYVIKQRREELGYTQEDLADGICSVPTLSRIENGERLPTKNHFEMLFQRLGLSDATLYTYVDENTLYLHELKFKIRQSIIFGRYDEAQELLRDYSSKADMSSPLERQFVLLNNTLSSREGYSEEERLNRFEEAIRLTCPRYKDGFFPRILSYEDIIILNNIAICHQKRQNLKAAIDILSNIKKYYETGVVNQEEILRTQTMVLYNLSKCLGLSGKYDECIEVCNLGIRIARATGRCGCLSELLYNRAWSLSKRMLPGDMEQAEDTAKHALFAAIAIGNTQAAEHYRNFIKRTFPQSSLLLSLDAGIIA